MSLNIYSRLPRRLPHSLGFKKYALLFGGVGDEVRNDTFPSGITDLTIEVLVKLIEAKSNQYILQAGNYENYNRSFFIAIVDNLVTYGRTDGSTIQVVRSASALLPGKWYHLTITDLSKTVKIYIDGNLDNEGTYTLDPVSTTTPFLVGFGYGDPLVERHLHGYIALVRIYSRALPENEIHYNMLNYHSPVRDGLVLWLADRMVGDTWADESGLGNNGTIYGAQVVKVRQYELRAEVGL